MKKIVGFQNKGGMMLTQKWEFNDKELLEILGAKGMKKFLKNIMIDMKKAENGTLECYPADQVLEELYNVVKEGKIKQYEI